MSRVGETGVGETGIGETGVGETGVGQMGVGETGPNRPYMVKTFQKSSPNFEDRFQRNLV